MSDFCFGRLWFVINPRAFDPKPSSGPHSLFFFLIVSFSLGFLFQKVVRLVSIFLGVDG